MKQTIIKYITILFLSLFAVNLSAQDPLTYMKNRITGRFDPAADPSFIPIFNQEAPISPMYLHRDAYYAFIKMRRAAQMDNINLTIVSAARSHSKQASIWKRKWESCSGTPKEKALEILRYSSMPGTSRHHWGTEVDLCSVEDSDWTKPQLRATLRWLNENAKKFGFYMPYSNDPDRPGYSYEPWHWSYYPLSDFYTDLYKNIISYDDIYGFPGASLAKELNVIEYYVLGIASH